MSNKKNPKIRTGMLMGCPCGAKAAVFRNGESRWFSHCPACGQLVFWSNPQLTQRLEAGAKVCPHNPPLKTCKDGKSKTSWCEACRVRIFVPSV